MSSQLAETASTETPVARTPWSRSLAGRRPHSTSPRPVAVLLQPGALLLDLAAVQEVLAPRGLAEEQPLYEVSFHGTRRAAVEDEAVLEVNESLDAVAHADTVIVAGARTPGENTPGWAVEAVQDAAGHGARVVGLGTGAFLLAESGLLDGRRATTHWRHVEALRRGFPRVRVEGSTLFVQDGSFYTGGGLAAAIDLCLELIRQDHGVDAANRAARAAVTGAVRPGAVPQLVERPLPDRPEKGLSAVRAWMLENLEQEMSVDMLAARAFMSRRQFTRVFRAETGTSAWQWLVSERLRETRRLLESSEEPVEAIGLSCGFPTPASFRLHFRRETGMTPSAYRAASRRR